MITLKTKLTIYILLISIITTFAIYGDETKKRVKMDNKNKKKELYNDLSDLHRYETFSNSSIHTEYVLGIPITLGYKWLTKWKKQRELIVLEDTIFNYNPTKQELYAIIGSDSQIEKDSYIRRISQDVAYFHISLLYKLRGDNEKSDEYWNKIRKELRDAAEKENKNRGLTLPSTIDKITRSIETVFDHNLTEKESEKYPLWQKYIYQYKNNQDKAYLDIYYLYKSRARAAIGKVGLRMVIKCGRNEEGKIYPSFSFVRAYDPDAYEREGYNENMEIASEYLDMISNKEIKEKIKKEEKEREAYKYKYLDESWR